MSARAWREATAADGSRFDWAFFEATAARAMPVLLAHGAGAGHLHPFLVALREALVRARFDVLAFHYPYMTATRADGRRRPPDPAPRLEAAHVSALTELARLRPNARALLVGKSMGGRIGSVIAAKGADARGLVLVGYPLHPKAKPDRLRSEHFRALVQPALFLSGTRDALCDLDLLRRELRGYGGRAELDVVEGADHDFARTSNRPDVTARSADLVARVVAWTERHWPE